MEWLKELVKGYNSLKESDNYLKCINNRNVLCRIFCKKKAHSSYLEEHVHENIDFSEKAREYISNFLKEKQITETEIKNGILSVKQLISQNESINNRYSLLLSLFTIIVTFCFLILNTHFDKLEILNLFALILIAFIPSLSATYIKKEKLMTFKLLLEELKLNMENFLKESHGEEHLS